MLADITRVEVGYLACFDRHFKTSVNEVWSLLTENEKLVKWFSVLSIDDLCEGGIIKFDMNDGTFEEMTITELKMYSVLEFTWGEDIVRFELSEDSEGCRLVLLEKMSEITEHTSKDLAGWHVCLDVIEAILDGRPSHFNEEEWSKWYEKYAEAVKKVLN